MKNRKKKTNHTWLHRTERKRGQKRKRFWKAWIRLGRWCWKGRETKIQREKMKMRRKRKGGKSRNQQHAWRMKKGKTKWERERKKRMRSRKGSSDVSVVRTVFAVFVSEAAVGGTAAA
jgi:hypothetical protein